MGVDNNGVMHDGRYVDLGIVTNRCGEKFVKQAHDLFSVSVHGMHLEYHRNISNRNPTNVLELNPLLLYSRYIALVSKQMKARGKIVIEVGMLQGKRPK